MSLLDRLMKGSFKDKARGPAPTCAGLMLDSARLASSQRSVAL